MNRLKKFLVITMITMMALVFVPMISGVNGVADAVSGTPITQSSFASGKMTIATDGQYYLDGDVTGDITVNSGINVTLNLNGHILSSAGTASVVTNNGTLTVKDSNKTVTHYYKVNADGLWVLDTDATSGTAY